MKDAGYKDRLKKHFSTYINKDEDEKASSDRNISIVAAKELLGALSGLAGKGKDELVQTICREIGQASAALFKEPITQLLKNRKLQITIELVPSNHEKEAHTPRPETKKNRRPNPRSDRSRNE